MKNPYAVRECPTCVIPTNIDIAVPSLFSKIQINPYPANVENMVSS